MHFFTSSLLFPPNQHSLWNIAEQYLSVSGKKYTMLKQTGKQITVQVDSSPSKHRAFVQAFKIASYATVFLPLLALAVKAICRYRHRIVIITDPADPLALLFKQNAATQNGPPDPFEKQS